MVRNDEAARALAAADQIELNDQGELRLLDPALNEELHARIRSVGDRYRATPRCEPSLIVHDTNTGAHPLLIEVSTLTHDGQAISDDSNFVLVTLIDSGRTPAFRTDRVCALHGLTQAESAVFQLLVNGHSTREIAEARGVQAETVISQVKSILHKTGSRERLDLVRLLINLSTF